MSSSGPIETIPLFPELSRRFVALLESLPLQDWQRPVSAKWRVRDVVAHLLDGSLRRLSAQRDRYGPQTAPPNEGYGALVDYLNALNADWVRAAERLSPRLLTELIRWSDERLLALLSSLDPSGPALWPVTWAGETQSQNWFDIAREYTEKWHHAQQIYEATGHKSTITDRALMHPCLDTLMRGLPNGLRNCAAPESTTVRVQVTGEAGDDWWVQRRGGQWQLGTVDSAQATVIMCQDDAWKVLMKRTSATEARAKFPAISVVGDQALGDAVLETVSVMA